MFNFLFKKSCAFCDKSTGYLCEDCKKILKEESAPNSANFCYFYDGIIKKAIINLKFHGKRYISKGLALAILDRIEDIDLHSFDIITYVPNSKKRTRERGFNQCELILKEICKIKGVKKPEIILKRLTNTRQSELKGSQRAENAKNAFKVIKNVENKKILLFDDVYTTGSTVNEIKRKLLEEKALEVTILVVAKTQNDVYKKTKM